MTGIRDFGWYRTGLRWGLAIAVVCMYWTYWPAIGDFVHHMTGQFREARKLNAAQAARKLSAIGLEAALQKEPQFGPKSQLHCMPSTSGWDYTCSYMPTPLQSRTRLQFGVAVDTKRWVRVSNVVPAGTKIPSP